MEQRGPEDGVSRKLLKELPNSIKAPSEVLNPSLHV